MSAIVIINQHEPEGEVAARLLALAEEKGYEPRVIEAQRGEHDAVLSFRVPYDVQDAFESDRADRWPAPEEVTEEDNPNTPPVRKQRPGKAQNARE